MNQIFKNESLDEQYRKDGFVVIPFVLPEQIDALRLVFDNNCRPQAESSESFYYSLLANDFAGNTKIKQAVKKILEPSYQKHFENYRTVLESFLAKPATGEPFLLHQDWSYCDEQEYAEATVWCPLGKTTRNNGALFAVKGSHRFFNTHRSGSLPTSRILAENGLENHLTLVEADEGSAVIFHPALFHGSHPNQTNELRVIASAIILQASAPMLYYHKKNENESETYEISEDVFLNEISFLAHSSKPQKGAFLESIPYKETLIASSDLAENILETPSGQQPLIQQKH